MAAAPHLFDDFLVASPELALVDVDLAAQLREDIRTGEEFRPRAVARPEFRLLNPVELDDRVGEAVDDVVELPEYVVPHDDVALDVEPVMVALDIAAAPPVVDALPELPDYVVAPEELRNEVEEGTAFDVALAPPVVEELSELPDYVVPPEELPNEVEEGTAFLDVPLAPPAPDEVLDLPDYVVRADDLVVEEPSTSDYPVLPDLGEASVALEETDVALRKIREHLASEESSPRHRRLRRGFVAASGLGAVAALAVFAVDVQLGVATLPSWLGF